jgi:signal transduction histidine kinase
MSRALKPFVRPETYRALLFFLAELGLGVAGFVLLTAGWPITLVLAITPLVVPVLIGFRASVGALAYAQAGVARAMLGTTARPRVLSPGTGFWGRGFNVLKDSAFWKQQAHLLISWPLALIPISVVGFALQLTTVPIWYRWTDSADFFGRHVDSFPEALAFFPAGLALLVLGAHLVGWLASVSRWLAASLLGDAPAVRRSPAEVRALHLRALRIHAGVSVATGLLLVAIWALTTMGYFWPIWALMPLALALGVHAWVVLVLIHPGIPGLIGGSEALAAQIGISVLLFGFFVGVWAASGGGYFWPIWPLLGLAVMAIVHAGAVFKHREDRLGELETTRAGAVDVQETELRRIERDLHDGAQARLVALGMSLGRAEQQLDSDPEAVRALIAEARLGAAEALAELRDLARGIRPPILTDRGLRAALEALVARSPVPVSLSVNLRDRPPAPIETAAYFTAAEALANAIKHGHATRVDIRIRQSDGVLVTEIVDDGDGGADPSGRGLTGLRQRAQAFDGSLRVESPAGGPTTVRAELPCGS